MNGEESDGGYSNEWGKQVEMRAASSGNEWGGQVASACMGQTSSSGQGGKRQW